ncbi:hypothetical protein AOLI_G00108720 [Acnodon oligacanthus]
MRLLRPRFLYYHQRFSAIHCCFWFSTDKELSQRGLCRQKPERQKVKRISEKQRKIKAKEEIPFEQEIQAAAIML